MVTKDLVSIIKELVKQRKKERRKKRKNRKTKSSSNVHSSGSRYVDVTNSGVNEHNKSKGYTNAYNPVVQVNNAREAELHNLKYDINKQITDGVNKQLTDGLNAQKQITDGLQKQITDGLTEHKMNITKTIQNHMGNLQQGFIRMNDMYDQKMNDFQRYYDGKLNDAWAQYTEPTKHTVVETSYGSEAFIPEIDNTDGGDSYTDIYRTPPPITAINPKIPQLQIEYAPQKTPLAPDKPNSKVEPIEWFDNPIRTQKQINDNDFSLNISRTPDNIDVKEEEPTEDVTVEDVEDDPDYLNSKNGKEFSDAFKEKLDKVEKQYQLMLKKYNKHGFKKHNADNAYSLNKLYKEYLDLADDEDKESKLDDFKKQSLSERFLRIKDYASSM